METLFLSVLDVQRLHIDLMALEGQASVLRDQGLLEGAVMRPRHAAFYEGADLFSQAAKLASGLAMARAFEDGNKRLAYAATIAFLAYNGVVLTASPIAIADQVVALVNRDGALMQAEEGFAVWLRARAAEAR